MRPRLEDGEALTAGASKAEADGVAAAAALAAATTTAAAAAAEAKALGSSKEGELSGERSIVAGSGSSGFAARRGFFDGATAASPTAAEAAAAGVEGAACVSIGCTGCPKIAAGSVVSSAPVVSIMRSLSA